MNFIYTVDPSAETPIMLINRHIGSDDEMGMGVSGEQFQAELLALDAMGKRQVDVWINSTGGKVMDGNNIVSAMLHTNCKVDTYNMGICASIAAVIFQAGRKRIMCDYSKLMYHNTNGLSNSEVIKQMNDLVATIVAVRSENQIESIKRIMDRTTWVGATEALNMGLCDEIKSSSATNKGRLSKVSNDASAIWKEANLILNSAIQKPQKMSELSKVNNRLGLNEEATVEYTLKAIEATENKLTVAQNQVKELTETKNALELEIQKLKVENETAKARSEEARKVAERKLAIDTVQNFVKIGKVANKQEAIDKWVDVIEKVGIETGKNMLEELPVNKEGADMSKEQSKEAGKITTPTGTSVIGKAMAEVRNKLAIQ